MRSWISTREPSTLGTVFSSLDQLDADILALRSPGRTLMHLSSTHG